MASASPLKIAMAVVVAAVALGSLVCLAKRAGASGAAPASSFTVPAGTEPSASASGELSGAVAPSRNIASLKTLGALFLDPEGFLIPFELISVLLLAAMVGAIAVARDEGRAP